MAVVTQDAGAPAASAPSGDNNNPVANHTSVADTDTLIKELAKILGKIERRGDGQQDTLVMGADLRGI